MLFNDVLENMDELIGQEVTISGWLVDASHRGFGHLFYLSMDEYSVDDVSTSILISRTPDETLDDVTAAISFIATYGKLSPIVATITGTLIEEFDSVFLLAMSDIISIHVYMEKWGYEGVYHASGVADDDIGLSDVVPVSHVLQNDKNSKNRLSASVALEGIVTGHDKQSKQAEVCYIIDAVNLAVHPGRKPHFSKNIPESAQATMMQQYEAKRQEFNKLILEERQYGVLIKYSGIFRKIIAPNYEGRMFAHEAIVQGKLITSEIYPFKYALDDVKKLVLKGENALQIWDLNTFPYGRNF